MTGPGVVARRWREFADELGYPVQPGASAAAVAVLVAESHALLGGAPPPEFLDLLRDQEGGEVNGLRFHATRDLVQVNVDMREGGGLDDHVGWPGAASGCARCTCRAGGSTSSTRSPSRWSGCTRRSRHC